MKRLFKTSVFAGNKGLINVVIETPKGSRNKYAYDDKLGILRLKKALPCGMVFPFNFGALPGTRGEDGDPLDILVLMEEPTSVPCLVVAQVIGVIKAEEKEEGQTRRNDRLIAVSAGDTKPSEEPSPASLDPQVLKEIESFFVNYNKLCGKKFRVLGYQGSRAAMKVIKDAV